MGQKDLSIEQAAEIYSEVYGFEVTPKELQSHRVHHPLGQHFWRNDTISLNDFRDLLEQTLNRQSSARSWNNAQLAKMAEKVARKTEVNGNKFNDEPPMGW